MDKKGIVVIKDNQIIASGINIVVDFEYDKLIEVDTNIAKQIEKFYFNGKELILKDGETLLTERELRELYEREQEL